MSDAKITLSRGALVVGFFLALFGGIASIVAFEPAPVAIIATGGGISLLSVVWIFVDLIRTRRPHLIVGEIYMIADLPNARRAIVLRNDPQERKFVIIDSSLPTYRVGSRVEMIAWQKVSDWQARDVKLALSPSA